MNVLFELLATVFVLALISFGVLGILYPFAAKGAKVALNASSFVTKMLASFTHPER